MGYPELSSFLWNFSLSSADSCPPLKSSLADLLLIA